MLSVFYIYLLFVLLFLSNTVNVHISWAQLVPLSLQPYGYGRQQHHPQPPRRPQNMKADKSLQSKGEGLAVTQESRWGPK